MDTNETQATAPTAATPAPSAPTPEAVTTPPAPSPDPTWLRGRLEQAERSGERRAAQRLGVQTIDEALAAINEGRTARERLATLEAGAARMQTLEQTVTQRATAELAGLSPTQQAAVRSLAGDDAARVLATIDALRPTWGDATAVAESASTPAAQPAGHTSAPVATPAAPAPKPPIPAPASTSAAGGAPPATAPATQKTALEVFEHLERTNPMAAAQYLNKNLRAISAERTARGKK